MTWRFLQVGCVVSGLTLACGGATRQAGDEGSSAGASAGTTTTSAAGARTDAGTAAASGGSTSAAGGTSAGNAAAAGAPPEAPLAPSCFQPNYLPATWRVDNSGGASSDDCPVAPENSFSISICYFILDDPVPIPPPPEHAGQCCYRLRTIHCR